LQGLAIEGVGKFCGNSVNFSAIWYILWPFDIFYGHLVYLPLCGLLYEEKSGNPGAAVAQR
jgi:hypothetical protein